LSDDKPVVYILHGDDEQAMSSLVQSLETRLGDPATAELNLSRLDARQASDTEIATAATALPFLADRRIVILNNALSHLNSKDAQQRFCKLLENLPTTTAMVLVISDNYERKDWTVLKSTHWLRQWAQQAGKKVRLQTLALPKIQEMSGWILKHAQEMGGRFNPPAAQALANHVGNNTRLALLEIEKLLAYVDFSRPVELDDVEELTATTGQTNIFDMVDNLAAKNTSSALRHLHALLETSDHLTLFGMIVRQFRLLLQTREILNEGGSVPQVQTELHQVPFVAEKLVRQVQGFTMSQLELIYHRLLALDESMKTSQMPPDLALDLFVAELTL
jgi:DNA polymerase III subunit delta